MIKLNRMSAKARALSLGASACALASSRQARDNQGRQTHPVAEPIQPRDHARTKKSAALQGRAQRHEQENRREQLEHRPHSATVSQATAPFAAIVAPASGSHVPPPWVEQLAEGGRIVMPVGDPGWVQKLVKVTKGPAGNLITEDLGAVRFVPLIGEEGWSDG